MRLRPCCRLKRLHQTLPVSRTELEQRWLQLTREELPALSAARSWPIRYDHCFQRVLLDTACGGCWYDHVAGRPAYRHAPDALLEAAVRLGTDLIDGTADLRELNARSLHYRGKAAPGSAEARPNLTG